MGLDQNRFRSEEEERRRAQAWTEWLSEDTPTAPDATPRWDQLGQMRPVSEPPKPEVAAQPIRAQAAAPQSVSLPEAVKTAAQADELDAPTVSIQINFSKASLPKLPKWVTLLTNKLTGYFKAGYKVARDYAGAWLRGQSLRKVATIGGSAALVLTVGLIGIHMVGQASNRRAAQAAVLDTKKLVAVSAHPSFVPAVPKSKPQLATVTPGYSSYDGKRDSYSFTDNYLGQGILVSEQPIPAQFSDGTDAVTKIAKQLGAKEAVPVNGGGVAFMATNSKSNAQTVVYSLKEILVFIQSPFTHTSTQWGSYLENLKQN